MLGTKKYKKILFEVMVTEKELSFIFKILRRMDFNYSEEEYGDVTIWNVIGIFYNIRLNFLEGMLDWSILDPIESRKIGRASCRERV